VITEVNVVNLPQNLNEILNQVQYRKDCIAICQDGKPIAALISAELFARICSIRERFDALSDQVAKVYADVVEADGMAEIDAMVKGGRKKD
jgi:prevent-host-death family protein